MKHFWFKKNSGDWLKDPNLSLCSPAARGVWEDAICRMYELQQGSLTGTYEQLSRALRATATEVECAFEELANTGTADLKRESNGVVTLICRRMERQFKKKQQTKLRVAKVRGNAECNASCNADVAVQSKKLELETELDLKGSPARPCADAAAFSLQPEPAKTDVEKIYEAFPKKVERPAALESIRKALKSHSFAKIFSAVQAYAAAVGRWPPTELHFATKPTEWFEKERFLDDPKAWERHGKATQAGTQRYAGTKGEFD